MLQVKVKAALRLLSQDENGGVLSLDDLIPMGIRENGEVVQQTTRGALMESIPKECQYQMMPFWTQVQPIIVMTQLFLSK